VYSVYVEMPWHDDCMKGYLLHSGLAHLVHCQGLMWMRAFEQLQLAGSAWALGLYWDSHQMDVEDRFVDLLKDRELPRVRVAWFHRCLVAVLAAVGPESKISAASGDPELQEEVCSAVQQGLGMDSCLT
jgi:hypothetical protein